jgi:hypothetical protein
MPQVSLKAKIIIGVVLSVVLFMGGSALGWYLKPEKVRIEEKIRVEQVEKQVVVVQEKVRVEVVKVKDSQTAERYRKETVHSPDGTVRQTEERNIDTVVKEKENTVEVKVVEVEKQVVVEKQVEKLMKVDPVLPNWQVSLIGGVELPTPMPVVGVAVDRRIAGPFWVGVAAETTIQPEPFQPVRGQIKARLGIQF